MSACVNETVSGSRPSFHLIIERNSFHLQCGVKWKSASPLMKLGGPAPPPSLLGGEASFRTQVLMTNTCRSAAGPQLSASSLKLQQFPVWDEEMMTDRWQLLHARVSLRARATRENLEKSNLTFWQEPFFLLEYNQEILLPPLLWSAWIRLLLSGRSGLEETNNTKGEI